MSTVDTGADRHRSILEPRRRKALNAIFAANRVSAERDLRPVEGAG